MASPWCRPVFCPWTLNLPIAIVLLRLRVHYSVEIKRYKSQIRIRICLNFCNKVLLQCDKPPQWSFMNIILVPKSGDLSVTDNYRGISLTCIMAKLFSRLILHCIGEVVELTLWKNQNRFRTKRTTVSHILAI